MKFIRYGKYVGEPADAVDLEELVKRMGDFFLQSGFESQFYGVSQMDPDRSMEALREAILRALQEGELLPDSSARGTKSHRTRDSKSRTRRSTFSASKLCRICLARSGGAVSGVTTRAIFRQASSPAAFHALMSLATR